jgi:hypothetical protein
MRRALALTAIAPLLAGLIACGGSQGGSHATAVSHSESSTAATTPADEHPAPLDARMDADHDNDVGASYDDKSNTSAFAFGHDASPSERHAIVALVKRYYQVALGDEGKRGCSMLYSTIAETAVEDDSREPGTPAYMHGLTTCAGVLKALFWHYHAQLAAEVPKLQVTRVRLQEHHGFAVLHFGTLPERRISVERERHTWKMSQIYDEELP